MLFIYSLIFAGENFLGFGPNVIASGIVQRGGLRQCCSLREQFEAACGVRQGRTMQEERVLWKRKRVAGGGIRTLAPRLSLQTDSNT